MTDLYLVVGGALLLAGAIKTAIHFAKRATKEKARADTATKSFDVAAALAEPVAPAHSLAALKARAKKRRDVRAAHRRKRGW